MPLRWAQPGRGLSREFEAWLLAAELDLQSHRAGRERAKGGSPGDGKEKMA